MYWLMTLSAFTNLANVVLILILVLPFICLAWYLFYWWKFNRHLKSIPGPKPWPLLGHATSFPNSATFLPTMLKLSKEYGSIFKLIIGLEASVTVSDRDLLETILSSTRLIEKASPYRYFHRWLGLGLLTSGGSKWKKHRKMITPAYHFQILDGFIPIFDHVSDILIMKLTEENERPFDVYPYVTLCALDIICETAMGTLINAQINKNSDYVKSVKSMCRIIIERTFSPFQQNEFSYYLSRNYWKERRCLKVLNEHSLSIIRRKRRENPMESKKPAFLDLLLQAKVDGRALNDEELREEVETFMFEGHDTTTSAISFALYLISQHPKVQANLFEEQEIVFGNSDVLSIQLLNEMKYLEVVIKETLRLYPSVPFYGRQTTEDIQISEDLVLPKGLIINIFAYAAQRNSRHFVNPDSFIPERFLTETHMPFAYIPFSAGPRNCIGQKFAMLEMKAVLSKVLRRFKLRPVSQSLELVSETILKSKNGIYIQLKKR